MTAMETQEGCVESKQSVAASGLAISEESYGLSRMPRAVSRSVTFSFSRRRTSGPLRRAKGSWTPEEDETLRHAVELHKGRNWKKIAESIPDKTEVQCHHRWQKVINPKLVKGSWTPLEDDLVIKLVAKYGPTRWSDIARSLPGRIGKQCRERWHNHLKPEIRKDAWTLEEEIELMKAHIKHGNKWAEIAKVIHGRTDNSIKNHWNSSLRKKLDYYLRTGKLPPVQRAGVLNTAQDTGNLNTTQLIYCSDIGLETDIKNIPETACTVSPSLPVESSREIDTASLGTKQFMYCSNSGLETDAKNVPETACIVSSSLPAESSEVTEIGNLGTKQLIDRLNSGLETYVNTFPETTCTVSSSLPCESSEVADAGNLGTKQLIDCLSSGLEIYVKNVSTNTCTVSSSQSVESSKLADTENLGTKQLICCSDTGLETNFKNVPETACTVSSLLPISSTVAYQHDNVNPLTASVSNSQASRDVVVIESDCSVSGECNAQVSEIVIAEYHTSDSGVKLKSYNSNGKFSQNEEPSETALRSGPFNSSFLCYKPPQLEDLVSGSSSLIAHVIASFSNCICSGGQNIESFLKGAARSFPSTPSIIRRKEAYKPLPSDTMQSNETRMHDGCTPSEGNVCGNTEGSMSSVSKFLSSPCASNGDLFTNKEDFNVSPPYRICSKRKETFRPVEKQLDFTLTDENSDGEANHSSLAGKMSSLSPKSPTVQILSMQRRRLEGNPAGGKKKRDFSCVTNMGVI